MPKIWPLHTRTHAKTLPPSSPAMQDSGSRRVSSPTVTIRPHKHWKFWMSEINLQLSITWKWLVGLFLATVKIVCSPKFTRSLKREGLNAKFVPLSAFGSFALRKINRGDHFVNHLDLEEKTAGTQQPVPCQQDPRERKSLHRKVFFYATQLRKTKRLKTRRKDCHTTACL